MFKNQLVPRFKNLPIVREFLDMFPIELSELSPNREIEFIIDLIPRIEPISIPPYQMAPTKFKELKVQL